MIKGIYLKQLTSLLKMPVMLFQAILFLVITLLITIFSPSPYEEDCATCIPAYVCATCEAEANSGFQLPDISLAGVFVVMFVGLTLLSSASGLVQEEKTTQNLRFLRMANVNPWVYLLGTMGALFTLSVVVIVLFGLLGRYTGVDLLMFTAVTSSGALISIVLGIGLALSKHAWASLPLSLLLGFGPMMSEFNDTVANVLQFTYTMQLRIAIGEIGGDIASNFIIIAINAAIAIGIFAFVHRKGKLQS